MADFLFVRPFGIQNYHDPTNTNSVQLAVAESNFYSKEDLILNFTWREFSILHNIYNVFFLLCESKNLKILLAMT